MDGMTSLLDKNLRQFLAYTSIILLCCIPLFFFSMKHFYTEDLDDLIIYRSKEFIAKQLPAFSLSKINEWNRYNEDMQILPFDDARILNKAVDGFLYSKSEGHNINYRTVYKKIIIEGESRLLMSRILMVENKDLFQNLMIQYGLIFLTLLLSMSVVHGVVSRKSWKPFYDSLNKIEHYTFEQGRLPEFGKTNIREFSRLNEILITLLRNNLKIYKQQKEFIENASHELQTPLAIFQSQLDMLLQAPDLTEKQADAMQSLYSASSRLTRLNKNLLLLAKIDNFQFKDVQEINIVELLNASMPHFKDLAENDAIEISIDIFTPFILTVNATLIESLINNLVMNAIRHNVADGKIAVRIENSRFEISNTGKKYPLEISKMFRRFNYISEEKKGTGLGLSIVYQICKLYGWRVMYNYEGERHIFTVLFS